MTRRELLAVIKAVTFRPYLYAREFVLRTDHACLLDVAVPEKRAPPSSSKVVGGLGRVPVQDRA